MGYHPFSTTSRVSVTRAFVIPVVRTATSVTNVPVIALSPNTIIFLEIMTTVFQYFVPRATGGLRPGILVSFITSSSLV